LSDTTNLAPAVSGAKLFDHIKHMVFTTGPSLIIALIVYLVLGFSHSSSGGADMSTIDEILGFITDNYKVSVLCLIPPVFVIVAVALKLPALPALIGGVVLGLPFFPMQGNTILGDGAAEIPGAAAMLNYGTSVEIPEGASGVIEELASLLSTEGMQGMMWTISLIMCAMVFGGIVDCTGIMSTIADALLKLARGTRGGLV
ncbi:sodium:proton antiporter, partial [Clostridiales bacterium]|nr:sodium:proton antiporter [Clostridiales bacterium]